MLPAATISREGTPELSPNDRARLYGLPPAPTLAAHDFTGRTLTATADYAFVGIALADFDGSMYSDNCVSLSKGEPVIVYPDDRGREGEHHLGWRHAYLPLPEGEHHEGWIPSSFVGKPSLWQAVHAFDSAKSIGPDPGYTSLRADQLIKLLPHWSAGSGWAYGEPLGQGFCAGLVPAKHLRPSSISVRDCLPCTRGPSLSYGSTVQREDSSAIATGHDARTEPTPEWSESICPWTMD